MMVEGTPKTTTEEQSKRMESIQQENRVLKMEVETYKLKCKQLQEDNRELRKASVSIVSKLGHPLNLYRALSPCLALPRLALSLSLSTLSFKD